MNFVILVFNFLKIMFFFFCFMEVRLLLETLFHKSGKIDQINIGTKSETIPENEQEKRCFN